MPSNYYTRFPEIDLQNASPLQRQVAEEIQSGPRKAVIGPFIPLLHAPELARRIQKVGEYLRFESSLPKEILECAVITVAHRWQSGFEWKIHSDLALKAGVPRSIVDAIHADAMATLPEDRFTAVVDFCRAALDSGDVGDTRFASMQADYGNQGVLELLTVCGYYSTLAMFLSTAGIFE
ncbi:carboxymuconolactone decarboxylase family protein [Variovorax sp. LT1R16]|uniref:carboxymuconolactone decarboxylase family protein n=1 Tax=Variovorax sp. LT1R16 TaxID=3443728 RepID=UPI003F46101C